MKKIYSLSLMLAAGVAFVPHNAHSFFTFDATAIFESVSSNSNLVKQYSKIKEATKTASDVSNSIGAAGKTFSELTIDKAKEAQEEIEKAKKEADRINQLRSDIETRQKELEAKKDLISSEVENAKAYKDKMDALSGGSDSYGESGNPYDIDEGYEDGYAEDYEEAQTPPSQEAQQEDGLSSSEEEVLESNEAVVEKPTPGRQEFGKGEEQVLPEEEELLDEVGDGGSAVENYGKTEEENVEDNGTALENYGDIEENEDGQAVENYGDPDADYSKEGGKKDTGSASSKNPDQSLDKAKDIPDKSKATPRGRQPFKKTSFYKNYELIASADILPDAKGKTYDGSYKGKFVIPQRLAEKCKLNVGELKENINMEECLTSLLKEMGDPNASAAADARTEYIRIVRDLTVGTVASSMKIAVESAEYEDTVSKPLADDVTSAGNTRDDISAGALVKLKGGTEITNRLTETTAHRLKLDAMRQLGYHKVEDSKAVTKKTEDSDSGDKK